MNLESASHSIQKHNSEEINEFLDKIIIQVEDLINELSIKDKEINDLQFELRKTKKSLKRYEDIEEELSKTIRIAEETSKQIQEGAKKERDILLEEAKKNADRIVNESLLKAEKTEMESNMLKKNIQILKNKIKDQIDSELDKAGNL